MNSDKKQNLERLDLFSFLYKQYSVQCMQSRLQNQEPQPLKITAHEAEVLRRFDNLLPAWVTVE